MMSDNKREQERTELYRTIWALANELRGSVDGWDFKQYVLGMLFYRYISENLTTYLNKGEWDAGNTNFDYAKISDEEASTVRDEMVQVKGFFILPSELFGNLLNRIKKADKDAKDKAEKGGNEVEVADLDENLNEILQTNFKNIEASAIGTPSEENFKGLFDDIDVNSNKLGPTVIKRNKRLKKLIAVIGDMNLGNYQDNSIDAFGDTYEYLMGMYAFERDSSVPVRDLQDYQSVYIDLYQDYAKKSDIEKERINDDIVFEIELIKQVEVNIDYILMLVAKYHESNCEDKTILANINKSIDASVELRSKKALIAGFVAQMTVKTDVEKDWKDFVKKQ